MMNSKSDCKYPNYHNLQTFFCWERHGSPLIEQLIAHVRDNAPEGMIPLRFNITRSEENSLWIEATYFQNRHNKFPSCLPRFSISRNHQSSHVAHVVPTSVGASIGGFAGDAAPATRLLASVSDKLITHPNVVNASDILYVSSNTLYVEGSFLDSFFLGQIALRQVRTNVLGVIIEKQPERFIDNVRYSIDAAHTTCGIPIAGYAVTKEKIHPRVRCFDSGAYTGIIENVDTLLEAAETLISQGATAIAITTEILDLPDITEYVQGHAPNPHGGVEALLSHTVARNFGVPSAHAPMWGEFYGDIEHHYSEYDPREAAELVTVTAIGCVLQGLSKAPQAIPIEAALPSDIRVNDLLAVVVPARAIGNIPTLASTAIGITVIGIEGNTTLHKVSHKDLGMRNYYLAKNYLEAAGIIAALRCGISIPSLLRPISNVSKIVQG